MTIKFEAFINEAKKLPIAKVKEILNDKKLSDEEKVKQLKDSFPTNVKFINKKHANDKKNFAKRFIAMANSDIFQDIPEY